VQQGVVLGAECLVAFLARADQHFQRLAEGLGLGRRHRLLVVEPLVELRHQAGQLLQPGEMRMVGNQLQMFQRAADSAEILALQMDQLLVQVAQGARGWGCVLMVDPS
jgi:hypothetical protein